MRAATAEVLRCPRCRHERTFDVTAATDDGNEIREGSLVCRSCGQAYEISEGIVDLLYDPPEFVRREAAGLERFSEKMRNDGWDREQILALPNVHLGYWYGQAREMDALLDAADLVPGRRLLDVGSNTCWASNIFASRGLDVVAVDITKTEMQGLRTAEYFFQSNGVFFERVLSVMFDLAIASESVDYAFCCEVLHHNDPRNLRRTMRELFRVLRPGGVLFVNNEPLRFPLNLKLDHGQEVAEYEGYEHVYFFQQYYLAARRAGFEVTVREPAASLFFGQPWIVSIEPDTPSGLALRQALLHAVRRHPLGRRLMLAYKTLLAGDVSLNMFARKPA